MRILRNLLNAHSAEGGAPRRRAEAPWITVEIIDVYPTSIGHCPHFNLLAHEFSALGAEFCPLSDQVVEYPKDIVLSHDRAAKIIERVKAALQGLPVNVSIELVEATSLKGTLKSIRHMLKGQSAIIINGRKLCEGYPPEGVLETAIRAEASRTLKITLNQ